MQAPGKIISDGLWIGTAELPMAERDGLGTGVSTLGAIKKRNKTKNPKRPEWISYGSTCWVTQDRNRKGTNTARFFKGSKYVFFLFVQENHT